MTPCKRTAGATTNLAIGWPSVTLSAGQVKYLSTFTFTLGGALLHMRCTHPRAAPMQLLLEEVRYCADSHTRPWRPLDDCRIHCVGGCFLLAGACYVWQVYGVLGMWRGVLVPCSARELCSLDW